MGITAFFIGIVLYFVLYLVRAILGGFYTVRPNERAVISSFGRAHRKTAALIEQSSESDAERYKYPNLDVRGPGGPYLKWPWQAVHKVSVATESVDIVWDPTKSQSTIEAVTKDNLTTGVNGQLRYRVCEKNLYPYFFGVDSPLEHVMGFFVSVLRERIANFSDPKATLLSGNVPDASMPTSVDMSEGVSINDLRKNLPLINQFMEEQCKVTANRYGIELDAALITTIDPPVEVDRALSAINSTRNQVAADISTARAESEQQITMSKRAVEIASNQAEAEVAPLRELAKTLSKIKQEGGSQALSMYLRNLKIPLYKRATKVIQAQDTIKGN